jgi:hypothetical protein
MNENNKSIYPLDMFEFIHHPKYGCHDHLGLTNHMWTKIITLIIVKCVVHIHIVPR